MTTYSALMQQDRRLVILRLLGESTGYSANEHLLHAALPGFGHEVSADLVRADLAWLDEQGLISLTQTAGVLVGHIRPRGLDVAAGRAQHPGVKRPGPED